MNERWFLSGKYLSILIFVLFPLLYIITSYITGFSNPFFKNTLLINIENIPFGVLLLPIPLSIILFIFAFFPSILPTPKLFNLRGYTDVIIEYNILKKILIGSICILIILIILYYLSSSKLFPLYEDPQLQELTVPLGSIYQRYYNELSNTTNSPEVINQLIIPKLSQNEQYLNLSEQIRNRLNTLDPYSMIYSGLMGFTFNVIYMILPVPISILIKLLLERYRKFFTFYYAKVAFN